VAAFVRAASVCAGVHRIGLLGSLTTTKPIPKDADVIVTIDGPMDLTEIARVGRRLKGTCQKINLGADVFLADTEGRYLGRICPYRECHSRVLCAARSCGRRQHLNDDLDVVTLRKDVIATPPIELWPNLVRRVVVPSDVEGLLLQLESERASAGTP
jgi:hypothetical protein